ncbi:hypothetical protein [Caballeronia sp. LZ043]|uniref:hypothetical protein n=1 Tax=Caballeronia sp. LZ043 TaxID=3038569 RepID=UPI00286C3032|nr:hypothetical protein [Caballeronia sp. LZ043]
MHALLIHPFLKNVIELRHTAILQDIYSTLGCTVVNAIHITERDSIFIDDEALLKPIDGNSFWSLPQLYGTKRAWTGKGLVLSRDRTGAPKDEPRITLQEMKCLVRFLNPDELLSYLED